MGRRDFTLFVGNLSERVSETILHELFSQAGPVQSVKIPTAGPGRQKSFGFIEFKHECSVQYAAQLMENTKLYGRTLKLDGQSSSDAPKQPPLRGMFVQPNVKERLGPIVDDSNPLRGIMNLQRPPDDHMRPQSRKPDYRRKERNFQRSYNDVLPIHLPDIATVRGGSMNYPSQAKFQNPYDNHRSKYRNEKMRERDPYRPRYPINERQRDKHGKPNDLYKNKRY